MVSPATYPVPPVVTVTVVKVVASTVTVAKAPLPEAAEVNGIL